MPVLQADNFFYISNDLLCIENNNGFLRSVNPAFCRFTGYSETTLLSQPLNSFIHAEDRLPLIADNQFNNGEISKYEIRFRCANGVYNWLLWTRSVSIEKNAIYCSAKDITSEKDPELNNSQAKHKKDLLQLNERRFRSLLHSGSDLISIINTQGNYTYLSPSIERLGYTKDFLLGKSFFAFVHPDDAERVGNAFVEISAKEKIDVAPFRFRNAEGVYRWITTIATNKLNDPDINGVVANSRDVTESMKLELDRELALARVQNLINNFTDGFILIDRSYSILGANARASEILGKPELLDNNPKILWDVFPEAINSIFHEKYEFAFIENENVKIVEFYPPLNRWFEVAAYPFQNNLTVFFKDITAAKIRELNLKLEKSVLKMNTDSSFTLKRIVDYYFSELNNIYPEMQLAVSLVDKKGVRLVPLSSPVIPEFCSLFDEGFPVAPKEGTCCGAAYFKRMSGIEDLNKTEIDPLFRAFALENNIQSVWSFPITNEKDVVLATLAAFYTSPKVLSEAEEELLKRIITFIQIIIECHQTRDYLEMNIERYRLVTQASKDAIYDWDVANDEFYWGEGLEKIFGYRTSISCLKWWEERVHPEDLPRVSESLSTLLADAEKNSWHAEYRFLRADKTYAYIIEDGFVIRNAGGAVIRMVGAMQDHTAVKENQQQILKQNNALREIARINSHYIRKPLANILALIQTIKTSDAEHIQELISLLEVSGYELDEITRQIARKTYL